MRHHQNMMENSGRMEQLVVMRNRMTQKNFIDNRGVLNQRNSMDNQNMGMQEMNAQHGQRIRLSDNTVEQSPIFGRQMSLAGNLHGQMRPRDNTDNKRNSYTKMIASGRTKRSDDSYSYSVTALHPAVSKLSQVFNNGLSMERIRLGMNDGLMTSYVARPLTYIMTPAVMSQSLIY